MFESVRESIIRECVCVRERERKREYVVGDRECVCGGPRKESVVTQTTVHGTPSLSLSLSLFLSLSLCWRKTLEVEQGVCAVLWKMRKKMRAKLSLCLETNKSEATTISFSILISNFKHSHSIEKLCCYN